MRAAVCNLMGLGLAAFFAAGCQSDRGSFADLPDVPSAPAADASGRQTLNQPSTTSPSPTGANTQATQTAPSDNGKGDPSNEPIRSGEMLHITFSDTPVALTPMDEKVRDDGTVTLMYNKSFHAAGKSGDELAKEIRKTYVPDYYAQLTASVIRDVARTFYVDGEVKGPSKQLYTGPIRVTQAVAACGGFTDFANKKKVRLIRANGKIEVINCKEALVHPEKDPEVYPGDKVHVPRSLL